MAPDNMKIHPLISDTKTLTALVDRLAKMPFVAVDTEFMRENSYWPELCLIQIASSDEAAAIDPMADGLDMKPLLDLLVLKLAQLLIGIRNRVERFHDLRAQFRLHGGKRKVRLVVVLFLFFFAENDDTCVSAPMYRCLIIAVSTSASLGFFDCGPSTIDTFLGAGGGFMS